MLKRIALMGLIGAAMATVVGCGTKEEGDLNPPKTEPAATGAAEKPTDDKAAANPTDSKPADDKGSPEKPTDDKGAAGN